MRVYDAGYSWVQHLTRAACAYTDTDFRRDHAQTRTARNPTIRPIYNISGMSFWVTVANGEISATETKGPRMGQFRMTTGEGGISPGITARSGGDLI